MKLKRFSIKNPKTNPPEKNGWISWNYGMWKLRKVTTPERWKKESRQIKKDYMSSWDFEVQLFLNVLINIKKKENVNLFELGAGTGDWSLTLAGVHRYSLIPLRFDTYRILALEAEPSHFEWTHQHFRRQRLRGRVVHGAVLDYNGSCKFYSKGNPAGGYGQSVRSDGNLDVPCYTFDRLVKDYNYKRIDIVQMDLQGVEGKVIKGIKKSKDITDYWMIGTHGQSLNKEIKETLTNYEVIIDWNASKDFKIVETEIGKVNCQGDGILLLKRKGL